MADEDIFALAGDDEDDGMVSSVYSSSPQTNSLSPYANATSQALAHAPEVEENDYSRSWADDDTSSASPQKEAILDEENGYNSPFFSPLKYDASPKPRTITVTAPQVDDDEGENLAPYSPHPPSDVIGVDNDTNNNPNPNLLKCLRR